MSSLLVIRHGQASFGQDDYDVLSSLGRSQSRQLGTFLARRGVAIHAVYSGPAKRHQDTAALMIEATRADGATIPDAVIDASFDEYPAFEVIAHYLPALIDDGMIPAVLAERYRQSALDPVTHRQTFEAMFRVVLARWAEGSLVSPTASSIETFAEFRERVRGGLTRLIEAHGRGATIAVVTSAGPCAASLTLAVSATPVETIHQSLVVANTAITELKYRDAQDITLYRFNSVPHLQSRALVTHR
ncbi:MAG: histidine phosphatase family protein [Nannocystaceae bacterium]|nr:histidine phosphatase family protein [Myxococcales bacterium]